MFGNRDKFIRRNKTQLRIIPAYQRLHAGYPAGSKIDLWLVLERQLVLLKRMVQLVFEPQLLV